MTTPRVCVLLFCAAAAIAQPRFEVTSIKPAPPYVFGDGIQRGVKIDGVQATFRGANLSGLILQAYRIRYFQLDGPPWLSQVYFDVAAKLPEGASKEQIPEMLQSLLEERFQLAVRRGEKEISVYALVVGKNGPNLTPKPAAYESKRSHPSSTPMTADQYANMVRIAVDRPVLNLTVIDGEYLFSFTELMAAGKQRLTHAEGDGPSAFSIVEQLGLKLEPRKVTLPYLTVDHVERTPTEN